MKQQLTLININSTVILFYLQELKYIVTYLMLVV